MCFGKCIVDNDEDTAGINWVQLPLKSHGVTGSSVSISDLKPFKGQRGGGVLRFRRFQSRIETLCKLCHHIWFQFWLNLIYACSEMLK